MRLASLLFMPGDNQRKLAKAQDCGADVLILDLEEAVALGIDGKMYDIPHLKAARRTLAAGD